MEIKQKIAKPIMPNELFLEGIVGLKQDGFKITPCIKVKDLTKDQVLEYGDWWKKLFFQHWLDMQKDV